MPPLIIYPEGGTTNGTALLKFKRGAFVGLNSIKPVMIKYTSNNADIEGCLIKFVPNIILSTTNLWATAKVIELPIF